MDSETIRILTIKASTNEGRSEVALHATLTVEGALDRQMKSLDAICAARRHRRG